MTDNDVPALLTVDDVAHYRGVTKSAASAFCRGLEVAGWYSHPGRAPIALYTAVDADVTCGNGHLKRKRSRGVCPSCRYEAKYLKETPAA